MSRLANILTILGLTALCVLMSASLFINVARVTTHERQPTCLGWASSIVLSGSMEPAIPVNSLIVFHEEPAYYVGDVVVFNGVHNITSHRVIETTTDGFVTKGDANNTNDNPITTGDVIGKVVLVVPFVGYLMEMLRTTECYLLLVGVSVGLFVLSMVMGRGKRKETDGEETGAASAMKTAEADEGDKVSEAATSVTADPKADNAGAYDNFWPVLTPKTAQRGGPVW